MEVTFRENEETRYFYCLEPTGQYINRKSQVLPDAFVGVPLMNSRVLTKFLEKTKLHIAIHKDP